MALETLRDRVQVFFIISTRNTDYAYEINSEWLPMPNEGFCLLCYISPGPCDYDVHTSSRGPAFSFGIKLPEPVAVQQCK